ncbi:hypothetical protein [Mycobacterium scrofulaceum]|uniref:PRC-barrel domain-containing protein n=1 Tax=Mycobacterium scrofulaceum TaxID=1783 RepID=A0A1X0K6V6_MYCSC|nr:hypothetical protein [Mycobacterium scrofulaceum]ORB70897.1 hypothetical protein BST44_22450 [Mycobacterium scrofulaceum]
MSVEFSRLRGQAVRAGEATLGRIADITLRPDGDDLVADQLVLVPNRWRLAWARLHPDSATTMVPAADIVAITRRGVLLATGSGDDG